MFGKDKSNILKGVAILLMMWHHCFLAGRYDGYEINFFPFSEGRVNNIAISFKICVSLFAFVSGYGLFLSIKSYTTRSLHDSGKGDLTSSKWIMERLCRTLSGFWFVVVLCWIILTLVDGRPAQVYGFSDSALVGICNMVCDFFGVAHIFGTPKLIATWWYMSAAVSYIFFMPLIYKSFEKLGVIFTVAMVFIVPHLFVGFVSGTSILGFLPTFCVGALFASQNLFEKWFEFWKKGKINRHLKAIFKFLIMLVFLWICYKLYHVLPFKKYWDIKWSILPLSVILFVNDYISKIPILNKFLEFLGKHSINIFLIHSFIRAIYGKDLIYKLPNFIVTIAVLLLISLVLSIIIEQMKKLFKYDRLVDKLIYKIRNSALN